MESTIEMKNRENSEKSKTFSWSLPKSFTMPVRALRNLKCSDSQEVATLRQELIKKLRWFSKKLAHIISALRVWCEVVSSKKQQTCSRKVTFLWEHLNAWKNQRNGNNSCIVYIDTRINSTRSNGKDWSISMCLWLWTMSTSFLQRIRNTLMLRIEEKLLKRKSKWNTKRILKLLMKVLKMSMVMNWVMRNQRKN